MSRNGKACLEFLMAMDNRSARPPKLPETKWDSLLYQVKGQKRVPRVPSLSQEPYLLSSMLLCLDVDPLICPLVLRITDHHDFDRAYID